MNLVQKLFPKWVLRNTELSQLYSDARRQQRLYEQWFITDFGRGGDEFAERYAELASKFNTERRWWMPKLPPTVHG